MNMNIFVSHAHEDAETLGKLKEFMTMFDINLFLAHADIEYGEKDFIETIKREISECDAFLLIGSQSSQESPYCNQEVGMAISHKKPIISTIHRGMAPWGFIDRQQAIPYDDIMGDLPCKLWKQILSSSHKNLWKKEMECLEALGIEGFSTENIPHLKLIHLEPNDGWNDYGYQTLFTIKRNQNIFGCVSIGFSGQAEWSHTSHKLPKQFPFLRNKFFSAVECQDNLADEEKEALCFLLNDVKTNDVLRNKYSEEEVLQKSLLRAWGNENIFSDD